MRQRSRVARERGAIGLFGYPERTGDSPFPVNRAFCKSLTMEWINRTQAEPGLQSFRSAIELIAAGEIDTDYCLERMFDLEDAPAALECARRQGDGAPR